MGAPTCRRGRGRRRQLRTLRGHHPPHPPPSSSLGLIQCPSSALAPFSCSRLETGTGVGTGFAEGLGAQPQHEERLPEPRESGRASPLLLLRAHPPGSFEGNWPFSGPPVATVSWGWGCFGIPLRGAAGRGSALGGLPGGGVGGADLVQRSPLGQPQTQWPASPSHPSRQETRKVECQVLGCAHCWQLVLASTHLSSKRVMLRVGQGPWGGMTLVRPDTRDPTLWFQL